MITNPLPHKSQLYSIECSQLGNRKRLQIEYAIICYNVISLLASTSSVTSLGDFSRYLDKVCPENSTISTGEVFCGRIMTCQAFSNQ